MNKKVLIIGAGDISIEYCNILEELNINFNVVGRSSKSFKKFQEKTNYNIISGGVENYLKNTQKHEKAIVAVGINELASVSKLLILSGITEIFIEKPGGVNYSEINDLKTFADKYKSNLYLAYNRRFFSSVIKLKDLILVDGGVRCFHFEFTEWSHQIEKLSLNKDVLSNWVLSNSSHILDLAFYLGGNPLEFKNWKKGSTSWHKTSSYFAGAGITNKGALFSYIADWESAGRWKIEIFTKNNKYILCPLEELKIINIGSVVIENVDIDDTYDKKHKPGFFLQTQAFINNDTKNLCSLDQQINNFDIYYKIAGYK